MSGEVFDQEFDNFLTRLYLEDPDSIYEIVNRFENLRPVIISWFERTSPYNSTDRGVYFFIKYPARFHMTNSGTESDN